MILQYSYFNDSELICFTTTRHGGVSTGNYESLNMGLHTGDSNEAVLKNRYLLANEINIPLTRMVMAQQMHTDTVYCALESDAGKGTLVYADAIPQTDALITNVKNLCITIQTADCVPVLLYDSVKKVIGVVHAGWRGTMHNITQKTIQAMCNAYLCKPEDIKAIIGPSISPEYYQVGDELLQAANKTLGIQAKELIIQKDERYYFDLWRANVLQLTNIGVHEANIHLSNLCTYSNPDFFSARKLGIYSGRIMSGLMLKE